MSDGRGFRWMFSFRQIEAHEPEHGVNGLKPAKNEPSQSMRQKKRFMPLTHLSVLQELDNANGYASPPNSDSSIGYYSKSIISKFPVVVLYLYPAGVPPILHPATRRRCRRGIGHVRHLTAIVVAMPSLSFRCHRLCW